MKLSSGCARATMAPSRSGTAQCSTDSIIVLFCAAFHSEYAVLITKLTCRGNIYDTSATQASKTVSDILALSGCVQKVANVLVCGHIAVYFLTCDDRLCIESYYLAATKELCNLEPIAAGRCTGTITRDAARGDAPIGAKMLILITSEVGIRSEVSSMGGHVQCAHLAAGIVRADFDGGTCV